MKKIKFKKGQDLFFKELKLRIDDYFQTNNIPKYGNWQLYRKIIFLGNLYVLIYLAAFLFPDYFVLLYFALGPIGVILGLNVGHDAAHNAVFKKRKWNEWALIAFDILGTNSYYWKKKHIYAHHPYPNVSGYDADIQQSVVVRIFPDDKFRKFHKYQVFYMPFLYMIYIFRWIFYRDFKDYFSKRIGAFSNEDVQVFVLWKMLGFKILYVFMMIILPIWMLKSSFWYIIGSFIMMTIGASLTITLVLLSAHVGEHSEFPAPNSKNEIGHSWAYHQLLVTNDFATKSKIANYLFGGFNHHSIHHLFPNICHIHYEKLTPILKKTAAEFGYPYNNQKLLIGAITAHFKLLIKRGNLEI